MISETGVMKNTIWIAFQFDFSILTHSQTAFFSMSWYTQVGLLTSSCNQNYRFNQTGWVSTTQPFGEGFCPHNNLSMAFSLSQCTCNTDPIKVPSHRLMYHRDYEWKVSHLTPKIGNWLCSHWQWTSLCPSFLFVVTKMLENRDQ